MSASPRNFRYVQSSETPDWAAAAAGAWGAPSWKTAAREYHETRGNRPLIIETEPERLARLRRLLMGSTSLERAWGELRTAHTRGRAAAATVEALVYGLRDGIEKLDPDRLRRLSELNEEQLRAVCERLQNFKPHIAPAWPPEEVEALAVIWSDLRHEAQSEHE